MMRSITACLLCPLTTIASLGIIGAASLPSALAQKNASVKGGALAQNKSFLQIPDGLPGKNFTVAKAIPKVRVLFIPGLDSSRKGTLWSSWGDGCAASNGKYYTSVGDHLGIDANSYVYEYDPATNVLRRVVDVLRVVMQALGLYGHGKIHSGIHEAADGKLYFTTYWGKHRDIFAAFKKKYKGSILLCYDPKNGKTENLGPIAPFKGLPASIFDSKRQMLYFHGVSRSNAKEPYTTNLVAYDVKSRKVKFIGGADRMSGNRAFLVGNRGRVYFSTKDGTLGYYDPATNKLGQTNAKLPASPNKRKGDTLRAGAKATKNGVAYGMTASGRLFAFDSNRETVKDLGPNFLDGDYTAAMVLSPDEKYLYFAPGAHGSGNRTGAPIVQYEIATGKRKVLAFLRDPLRQQLKWNIGGTYNFQIDTKGETLFITFNGASNEGRRPRTFGQPAVVVFHIPKSER